MQAHPMAALSPPQPTLSLCLPTYNRCGLLRVALETLLEQVTPTVAAQVEIIVADNASPDATKQTVEDIIALHSRVAIRYFRQTKNTGSDGNIQTLLQLARGEFFYLLADDDLLLPGALEKLLTLIAAHPTVNAFCLNIRPFEHDITIASEPFFAVPEDTVLSDKNAKLQRVGTLITFLSIFAFRRDLVTPENYTTWLGSFIVQSYYFVDVLAQDGGLLITAQPYLGIRDNNSAGYSFFKAFVTNYAALLNYAQKRQDFDRDTINSMMQEHLRVYLFNMIYFRFKRPGGFGSIKPRYLDGVRRLLAVYGMDPFLLFKLIPVMLTPRPLLIPGQAIYSRFKRIVKLGKAPA